MYGTLLQTTFQRLYVCPCGVVGCKVEASRAHVERKTNSSVCVVSVSSSTRLQLQSKFSSLWSLLHFPLQCTIFIHARHTASNMTLICTKRFQTVFRALANMQQNKLKQTKLIEL